MYSTLSGRLCPGCGQAVAQCRCKAGKEAPPASGASTVYLHRERKGRAGKDVTVIKNLPLGAMELKLLASQLKTQCGSGGTVMDGNIEIQGDHRERLRSILEARGFRTRLSGG